MEKLTLTKVLELCGGRSEAQTLNKVTVSGVSTDSREIRGGDLFVALKGDRFNGHDFLNEAVEKGAAAAMVESKEMQKRPCAIPLVYVDHSLAGLQLLAKNYRASLQMKTVAVVGSNGKTSTKEMVASVLSTQFSVLKNIGNLNNHVGVPLSLMRLKLSHQVGVLEIGTNHPGELAPLLEMVQPLAGVITVIGEEHLEYFHDLEGVAQEEGTLAEVLPEHGLLALHADDEWSSSIARRCKSKVVYFGFSPSAEYRATNIRVHMRETQFQMITPRGSQEVKLKWLGHHQVANALAAAAVGEFFGLELDQIRRGLELTSPVKMRMETKMTRRGVLIINDTYNANPSSVRAALATVRDMPISGRRFAVLGEMRELGEFSESAHREIGIRAVESGIDILVVIGEEAKVILQGACEVKQRAIQTEFFLDTKSASEFLKERTHPGDVVLMKASRGAALERILEGWE